MDELENKLPPILRSQTPIDHNLYYPPLTSNLEIASFKYTCKCSICHKESNMVYQTPQLYLKNALKNLKNLKGFSWLLEKLSEISNDYPVRINVPDIALFKSGKVVSYIQTTREKQLKCFKSYDKVKIQEVIKSISSISRTRKREEISNNRVMLSVSSLDTGKETACLRYMTGSFSNEIEDFGCLEEDGPLKVMSENEFMGLLWQRPSSNLWKTLAYIQSVLKCKNGIGESIVHSYTFKNCLNLPDIESSFSDEEEYSLYLENPLKFCESIFLRIFAYLDKFLGIQLKSIQGEFVKDENNRIWLVHATYIRFKETKKVPVKIATPKQETSFFETEVKEELIYHLEVSSSQPKNLRTEKLSQFMKEECDKIMQAAKFIDFFSNIRIDKTSIAAYEKLNHTKSSNRNEVKRCASEQKKLKTVKHSENSTKCSSPVKSRNWIIVPKLKFSSIQSRRKLPRLSKSPVPAKNTIL